MRNKFFLASELKLWDEKKKLPNYYVVDHNRGQPRLVLFGPMKFSMRTTRKKRRSICLFFCDVLIRIEKKNAICRSVPIFKEKKIVFTHSQIVGKTHKRHDEHHTILNLEWKIILPISWR